MPQQKILTITKRKNQMRDDFFLQNGIAEQWMGLRWLQNLMYSSVLFH